MDERDLAGTKSVKGTGGGIADGELGEGLGQASLEGETRR